MNGILLSFLDSISLLRSFFESNIFIIFILLVPPLELPIYEINYTEYILKKLRKLGFDLIYSLITILLRSNNLNLHFLLIKRTGAIFGKTIVFVK